MKVKDLIIKLLDFDQDAQIFIDNNECKSPFINLSWHSESEGSHKKDSQFIYIEVNKNTNSDMLSEPITFMKMFKEYVISENDIDTFISEWHDGNSELELHQYLGMTEREYGRYLTDGILER